MSIIKQEKSIQTDINKYIKKIVRQFSIDEQILLKLWNEIYEKHNNLTDNIDIDMITKMLDKYVEYVIFFDFMNTKINNKKKKIRRINFPEAISENIVKFAIYKNCNIMPLWDISCGDLIKVMFDRKEKIEVKAFSSTGPSSFGPTETWDILYFLDATDYIHKKFIVYEISLSNTSKKWQELKMNKKDTYKDQVLQGRRPRMAFNLIKQQIPSYVKIIFKGHISKLL